MSDVSPLSFSISILDFFNNKTLIMMNSVTLILEFGSHSTDSNNDSNLKDFTFPWIKTINSDINYFWTSVYNNLHFSFCINI